MTFNITKASGETEPFSLSKVRESLSRVGLDKRSQDEVLAKLSSHLYEGITTKEIYSLIRHWLQQRELSWASRYDLKKAIMALGPTGYPFERFMVRVLQRSGFQTRGSTIVNGHCVNHEIDVLAQKNNLRYMGECKFHNHQGVKTDVKVALYVQARFLDIKKTPINFFDGKTANKALLMTNTKLTSEAIAYCRCMGMAMISWSYPPRFSLRELVEKGGLHPITCLSSLTKAEKKALLKKELVFCDDLVKSRQWYSLIDKRKIERVKTEAEKISNTKSKNA